MFKKLSAAFLALAIGIASAQAQGVIGSGHVLGNGTASSRTPTDAALGKVMDQALCATDGSLAERASGVWGCLAISSTVAASLTNTVGTAGAPVLFNGVGGTPSSLTLTNATGLPISGIAALGNGVATALGNTAGAAAGLATFNQLGAPALAAFGTASGQVCQGGAIVAGGPTGGATTIPVITYNACGQITALTTATAPPGRIALLEDHETQNTTGTTVGTATTTVATLNTTVSDINSLVTSLTSNVFTLPAGTYEISWSVPFAVTSGAANWQSQLYQTTGTPAVIGLGESVAESGNLIESPSRGTAIVAPGGSTGYELRIINSAAGTIGHAANLGIEVYSRVTITKLQ